MKKESIIFRSFRIIDIYDLHDSSAVPHNDPHKEDPDSTSIRSRHRRRVFKALCQQAVECSNKWKGLYLLSNT